MTRRLAAVVVVAFAVAGAAWLTAGRTDAATRLLPNLVALPARDLNIITTAEGERLLRFTTTSWNNGAGPLELRPGEVQIDIGVDEGRQRVVQRVYTSDGSFEDPELSVWMAYHPAHNHFHVDNYASYQLMPASGEGLPRNGTKTSFCIIDTDRVSAKLPGAPKRPVYSLCGTDRQGMSVGWGDSYGYHLDGQSIDITGLDDGDYVLSIHIDPQGHFLETSVTDNVSTVNIRITGSTVQILGAGGRGGRR